MMEVVLTRLRLVGAVGTLGGKSVVCQLIASLVLGWSDTYDNKRQDYIGERPRVSFIRQ